MSVRYGTRKRLDAFGAEETVTMRSETWDTGDSFVEDQYAYWTSQCPKAGHTNYQSFLKVSLDDNHSKDYDRAVDAYE